MVRHNIQLDAINFDTLKVLRAEYESINTQLTGDADKAEVKDSELKKFLLGITQAEPEVANTVREFKSQVRELFYQTVDDNPRTILALVEAVSELKTDALNERDHWINKVKAESQPVKVTDEDYETKRETAKSLGELIRQLYSWVVQKDPDAVPHSKSGDSYGEPEFPLNPVKQGGEIVKGKFSPRLSNLAREISDSPSGRAAMNSNLRFSWNGAPIVDKLPSDIAHDIVSDFRKGFVIDWSGIRKVFKDEGHEVTASMKYYAHEFPTGILAIEGKPKQ
jgi:hypothetical protein